MHKVKPIPYEFCEKCILNGCYPWNRNPLLRCSLIGGMSPPILTYIQDSEELPRECLTYKAVTEEMWLAYLSDLKKEAERNEEAKKRAMSGDVYSNGEL